MKMSKNILAIMIAGLFAGSLSTAAQSQEKSLSIGFITTLSGPGSALGIEARDGFTLAVDQLDQKLGGVPANVVIADDQQDPQIANQSVSRMLKRDHVDMVTGIIFSSVLLPVVPKILKSKIPYLSINTGPRDYAAEKCDPYFFSTAWQNEDIPAAMGQFATDRGYEKVAMIAPNYPGGRESLGGFKRLYQGDIVAEIYTNMGQMDYGAELSRIKAADADAVFIFLPGGMGVNFIKQFNGSGLSENTALLAPGFSADEDTIKAVGEALVGAFNSSQWAADLENDANKKFVDDFEIKYKRTPSMYAAQAYDAALLIDAAIRQLDGKWETGEQLASAIRTANYESIRGDFKFNNNQYPIQNIYMREVVKKDDGQITNKLVGTILENHEDYFASSCAMGK